MRETEFPSRPALLALTLLRRKDKHDLHDLKLFCQTSLPFFTELYSSVLNSKLRRLHICACVRKEIVAQRARNKLEMEKLLNSRMISQKAFDQRGIRRSDHSVQLIVTSCAKIGSGIIEKSFV